jgi:hypothetical protein
MPICRIRRADPRDGPRLARRFRRRVDATPQPGPGKLAQKTTARAFYRAIGRIGTIDIPENVGDFRLLSHRAVTAPPFSRAQPLHEGLFAWVGFSCREIEYDRDGRYAGETSGATGGCGILRSKASRRFRSCHQGCELHRHCDCARCICVWRYVVAKTLLRGDPVPGYPTLVTLVLFLGGLQLMALGIIGEYLARMFIEVKQRPLYLVQRRLSPLRPIPAPAPIRDAVLPETWSSS